MVGWVTRCARAVRVLDHPAGVEERYKQITEAFKKAYGAAPDFYARAPGRSLMGRGTRFSRAEVYAVNLWVWASNAVPHRGTALRPAVWRFVWLSRGTHPGGVMPSAGLLSVARCHS